MSIFGISLFGSEHVLRAGDAIINGGLNLLCYENVSLIDTPTLQLRATGVDVLLYQYSQLVLLRHSNDRLASNCLVAVPTFKIISLAEVVSKVCCCIQNYFCHRSS